MSKTIIFCADGTWNGPDEADSDDPTGTATNVYKLFLNLQGEDTDHTLRLANEQERVLSSAGGVAQHAKYLHGVGDSSNPLFRALGGGLGAGLITRIVRGYTFLSRNYQDGDKIVLVGFSRGAYTARALAGMILAKGLLNPKSYGDREDGYKQGAAVWYEYRMGKLAARVSLLEKLERTFFDNLPKFLSKALNSDDRIPVKIEAIAVWDTVGAFGIPTYNLNREHLDLFQFADTALSADVGHGIHAVSIDEQRGDFTPTFWSNAAQHGGIKQALFPGAHSDVGGGYPATNKESGLSDIALEWMTNELAALGVKFIAPPKVSHMPDALGCAHAPWLDWKLIKGPRVLPDGLMVSRYLQQRLDGTNLFGNPGASPGLYDPTNMSGYLADRKVRPEIKQV
jgi:uncharacterized protein (DUF2235 family)